MKTIFLFLLSAALFTSCNNTNSDTKKEEVKKDEVKKDTKENNTETKKGWSDNDRKQFHDDCVNQFNTMQNASGYCDCGLPKAEAIFTSYDDMKKGNDRNKEDEYIRQVKKDCGDN